MKFSKEKHPKATKEWFEAIKSMIREQMDIQGKMKPIDRWLAALKKHIEQTDIYFKYKGKKTLTESEQILFAAAKDYLKTKITLDKTLHEAHGREICLEIRFFLDKPLKKQ